MMRMMTPDVYIFFRHNRMFHAREHTERFLHGDRQRENVEMAHRNQMQIQQLDEILLGSSC